MRLLFVCTGNTCRSPLAEAIARKAAIDRGLEQVDVASAGTNAWEGAPASDGALLVGMERRFDLSTHRARTLTREMVDEADLLLVMAVHHLERAEALGGAGKAHLLTSYASRGASTEPVRDPVGAGLDVYRVTADELQEAIEQVFDRLETERPAGPT